MQLIRTNNTKERGMKTNLLNIQDELDVIHDAYVNLQVVITESGTGAELLCPILKVLNEKLGRVRKDLNTARKGN